MVLENTVANSLVAWPTFDQLSCNFECIVGHDVPLHAFQKAHRWWKHFYGNFSKRAYSIQESAEVWARDVLSHIYCCAYLSLVYTTKKLLRMNPGSTWVELTHIWFFKTFVVWTRTYPGWTRVYSTHVHTTKSYVGNSTHVEPGYSLGNFFVVWTRLEGTVHYLYLRLGLKKIVYMGNFLSPNLVQPRRPHNP